MPHSNAVIAGRDVRTRRLLIAGSWRVAVDVLGSVPEAVPTAVSEVPPEILEEGGRQEPVSVTDNISLLLSLGRSPELLPALPTPCTDVTQDVVGVERRHVHVVPYGFPHGHIRRLGFPWPPPAIHGGSPAGSAYRRPRAPWRPEPQSVTPHPSPASLGLTACP